MISLIILLLLISSRLIIVISFFLDWSCRNWVASYSPTHLISHQIWYLFEYHNLEEVHTPLGHVLVLYSHLQHHNDTTIKTQEGRHMKEGRRKKTSFQIYFTSHFIARVRKGCWRFACEMVLETEHKLHILTPLLWPSRCVFLVLLDAQPEVLGSTQSEVSEGPLGRVWPSLPHLVSGCLEVCWQLLWDPNSTELNNNSTPTRSPTGSLKSNV